MPFLFQLTVIQRTRWHGWHRRCNSISNAMELHLSCNGVTSPLQWGYISPATGLHFHCNGVTSPLQWSYISLAMELHLPCNGVTSPLQWSYISPAVELHILCNWVTSPLQWGYISTVMESNLPCSGVTSPLQWSYSSPTVELRIPVLKIRTICHVRDLWKLARSCKQLCLLCSPDPFNLRGTALLGGGDLKSNE